MTLLLRSVPVGLSKTTIVVSGFMQMSVLTCALNETVTDCQFEINLQSTSVERNNKSWTDGNFSGKKVSDCPWNDLSGMIETIEINCDILSLKKKRMSRCRPTHWPLNQMAGISRQWTHSTKKWRSQRLGSSPVGTRRNDNVVITSKRRRNVVLT